ncbi:unnamed protein product [Natator depressus]
MMKTKKPQNPPENFLETNGSSRMEVAIDTQGFGFVVIRWNLPSSASVQNIKGAPPAGSADLGQEGDPPVSNLDCNARKCKTARPCNVLQRALTGSDSSPATDFTLV